MTEMIVGIDGSANSVAALRWARGEAALRGDRLVALFAWGFVQPGHAGDGHTFDPSYGGRDAELALAATLDDTLGPEAAGDVEHRVVCGPAVHELRRAAAAADLLVVGARGIGGLRGALLGSVSRQLLSHPPGPLAIVPATAGGAVGRRDRIVVGHDGSPSATRALTWAADEACRRHAGLVVVRTWHAYVPVAAPAMGYPVVYEAAQEAARAGLDHALAGLAASHPRVAVADRLVEGVAAPAILDAAADAGLVVLGTRGHGSLAAGLVGSVTHEVAHRCPAAVVIVP